MLVTEAEQVADDQVKRLFERLRQDLGATDGEELRLSPKSVGGLTDDYTSLAKEFQERFATRLAAYSEQVS